MPNTALVSCRPVPHSLYDYDGAEICLIVKDKQGAHSAAFFRQCVLLLRALPCIHETIRQAFALLWHHQTLHVAPYTLVAYAASLKPLLHYLQSATPEGRDTRSMRALSHHRCRLHRPCDPFRT